MSDRRYLWRRYVGGPRQGNYIPKGDLMGRRLVTLDVPALSSSPEAPQSAGPWLDYYERHLVLRAGGVAIEAFVHEATELKDAQGYVLGHLLERSEALRLPNAP